LTHSTMVDIPRVFWHPELVLPRFHHYGEKLESFDENCVVNSPKSSRFYVTAPVIINTTRLKQDEKLGRKAREIIEESDYISIRRVED